jgi:hypothetical protein
MAVRRGEEENGREGKRERKSGARTGEGQQCVCVGREERKEKKRIRKKRRSNRGREKIRERKK